MVKNKEVIKKRAALRTRIGLNFLSGSFYRFANLTFISQPVYWIWGGKNRGKLNGPKDNGKIEEKVSKKP